MRKGLYLFFIFNCLLFTVDCFGQSSKVDSLLKLIETDKADTNKVVHLNSLSEEYYNSSSYDSALFFANSALQLSSIMLKVTLESNNKQALQKQQALSYGIIGSVYDDQGDYPEALKNYIASLKIYEALGDKNGQAYTYNNLGNIYDVLGNYPEALKNHFASLKICEAIGDKKGIARSYNNMGIVYKEQGNFPEALKNHFASLKIRQEMGNKKGEAYCYNNIGNVYSDQAEQERDPVIRASKLELSLKNYLASLVILEELGNKSSIASSYNNIGIIYKEQGNYPAALKSHFSALKIREATGDKAGMVSSYTNIGNVLIKEKKYNEAEGYFMRSIKLSKEAGYKEYLKHTYSALTELDSSRGNYKGAYENHKLYILYRDSLVNEETLKRTIQSQMTYDFEKKEAVADAEHKKELENQQLLAEEKSRKQKMVLLFVVSGLLLVAVFAGFIFRSLRITRKQKNIIETQKNIVEKQKLEVEQQKLLVEEHQKSIIDSITYARRIQRSQLPTEKYIDRTLKRLTAKR